MIKFIYGVGIFLIFSLNSLAQQGINIDPEKLTWDNYRGTNINHEKATAATASNYFITYDTTGVTLHNFKVYVLFYPSLSWVNWDVLKT